ncbi:MAG TPA: SPFH domain-containing protein [Candidatus Eisenbacteria bacterium]|nr:SPFH domain-containing protein [Candidatus Eisenbacteria bacterium]
MGIVEKLRGELVDIIEWVDDSRNTLVWRFPRYHNQIKNGARLIVRPGQSAVVVEQGRVADVFGPGTYELTMKNLPLLSTLRGWKYGFDSPFKAEVYFVATRQITELKWGTPNPVILRDPSLGPLRVRAFGTYTLRAAKPEALLAELVGTDGSFQADEIDVLLRSLIATAFADLIATTQIAIADLSASYLRLSEELRKRVLAKIDQEYGLDIPQLYIVNVSVPDSVEQAMDARSGMEVIGDVERYQRYQVGAATPLAAANPSGGLAGAGVGLGMGLSYAGAAASRPVNAPVIPPVPLADAVWHVATAGTASGPFTLEQIRQGMAEGKVTPQSHVWTAGMSAWAPIASVPALAALLTPPPPPRG